VVAASQRPKGNRYAAAEIIAVRACQPCQVRAQRVVDAFKAAETSQSAAIQLDGQFVDHPIVHQAQRVLATDANIKRNISRH
jgi:citrate lyase beta subunit